MRPILVVLLLATLAVAFFIAATIICVPRAHAGAPRGAVCGTASWYGSESGSRTASGALFRPDGLSAAMPSRAMLGKTVRVTDQRTGRSVVVRVNDLGPARWTGRVIDLSRGAARRLRMIKRGTLMVCVTAP